MEKENVNPQPLPPQLTPHFQKLSAEELQNLEVFQSQPQEREANKTGKGLRFFSDKLCKVLRRNLNNNLTFNNVRECFLNVGR